MRLFDRLLAEPVRIPEFDTRRLWIEGKQPHRRITIDDVMRLYWQSEQDFWDLSNDFGPMRPPFDLLWIEGQQPRRQHASGEWHTSNFDITSGAVVQSADAGDHVQVNIEYFTGVRGLPPAMMHIGTRLRLDLDGAYRSRQVTYFPKSIIGDLPEDQRNQALETMGVVEADLFKPYALALSLINCRNVKLEDVAPPDKLSKRHKRKTGRPLIKTTRIVLPSTAYAATTKDQAVGAVGAPQPLHLVRGHFKTYTDDKPLFGKQTGTWWWGWQARGNADAGQRDHTYEVIDRETIA